MEDELRERDDLDDAARIVARYLNRAPRSLAGSFVKRARAALRASRAAERPGRSCWFQPLPKQRAQRVKEP